MLALGTLADELEPSDTLTGEIGRLAATAPTPIARAAAPPAAMLTSRRTGGGRRWPLAAAAAAVVVVVFAAGWLAGIRIGAEARYSYLVQAPGGAVLQFSGVAGDDAVTVWMAGLDRLPADQRYQLWAIRDGRWLTIGVCNTNAEGRWRGDFAFSLVSEEEIALTIEPKPGSEHPTAEPVIRTRF